MFLKWNKMIKFKHESDQDCFLFISPKLGEIMIDMFQWFNKCDYDFIITSVIRKEGEGVSTTHQEGRAFDCRAKHLDSNFIKDTITYFNHKYQNVSAYSASTGKPNLIVAHGKGDNFHFHIQLNRKYANIYSQNFFREKK